MLNAIKKLFGSANDRRMSRLKPMLEAIAALEPDLSALDDDQLRAKTAEFKDRLAQGASLDSLQVEAFAVTREAAKRALGQRHYDVQMLGGHVLHGGAIAEMRTGEGKTLVATAPVYLNALTGKGVHVITVNDYLASRDAEWMGQVYRFLGLEVGCIVHGLTDTARRRAYAADVTYGTNNEFGFDYLRDNMKYALEDRVQRGHHYAIVDEVDSILIDEARTPLIISGPTDDRSDFYRTIDEIVPTLPEDAYELDEKQRSVTLTEEGNEAIETLLTERGLIEGDLYDVTNVSVVHHVNQALRAHKLYQRDKDYIVKGGKVVLIDEFTGRMMEGRRLSEGLHQAIEAKENAEIQPENVTLASITFQNYFRLYDKLAGMTGTASTEAGEFADIYKLDVVEIPTNKPVQRIDDDDEVYRTADEKYAAIIADIAEAYRRGQPVLVGTVSIEKSETLSRLLGDRAVVAKVAKTLLGLVDSLQGKDFKEMRERLADIGAYVQKLAKDAKPGQPPIPHQVLNARYHEQEARIIAQAGAPGAVTIATNMAGRGTDIQLGGNVDFRLNDRVEAAKAQGENPSAEQIDAWRAEIAEDVKALKAKALEAGGLYVLGTERHESRRIDNQLRGRTGRQGDPGRSKFFVSVEDDLMRIFAPERMNTIMKTLGMKEGEAIAHPWMSKALETAQKRVEQRHFEVRKNLLKFDNVINDQRKAIFEQRLDFMTSEDVGEVVRDMRHEVIDDLVTAHIPPKAYPEQWDIEGLGKETATLLGLEPPLKDWAAEEGIAEEEIRQRLTQAADRTFAEKAAAVGPPVMRRLEKQVLLQTIDHNWREHLTQLDHMRSTIHLRGYAQRDPLNEFKTEGFSLFEKLLSDLRSQVTRLLMNVRFEAPPEPEPPRGMVETHIDPQTGRNEMADAAPSDAPKAEKTLDEVYANAKVPRNAPCPCGSGKKFKHCHGKLIAAA